MIIGLCGAARSGKDTIATMLAREWSKQKGDPIGMSYQRAKRVQVAGPLKQYCRDVFGWTEDHTDGDLKDVPDERYNGLTPRHAMQFLGGEFAKATYPTIYSERAARVAKEWHEAKDGNIALITDLRFIGDLRACKEAGGLVIMVERPDNVSGLKNAAAAHMSETERQSEEFLDLVDIDIVNDGTLEDLKLKVETLVRGYLG